MSLSFPSGLCHDLSSPPSSGGKLGDKHPLLIQQVRDAIAHTREIIPNYGEKEGYEIVGFRWNHQAIKNGLTVLYRSIFDVVRDFLHDEPFDGDNKVLARYLKPDLLIVDDDDVQPAAGGLGQADRRRPCRHGDPGPVEGPGSRGSAGACRPGLDAGWRLFRVLSMPLLDGPLADGARVAALLGFDLDFRQGHGLNAPGVIPREEARVDRQ